MLIQREPDLGATFVLVALVGLMLFVSGLKWKWIGLIALVAPIVLAAMVYLEPHAWARVNAFMGQATVDKGSYQPDQALIAVGTGGIWGRGWMAGIQKQFYLPMSWSDYIFASIAEEGGLIMTLAVLGCYGLVIWRGLSIASRTPDAFGSLVATGITAIIGMQALVNMSMVIKLLPSKGIALPLVSHGGSSMLASMLAIGLLLNISRKASVN